MTIKKDEPGKDNRPGDNAQQKRPYATIDVKATEIKSEPAKPAAATSVPPAGAAKPAEASKPAEPAKAAPAATGAGVSAATDKKDGAGAAGKGGGTPPSAAPPAARGGGAGRFFTHLLAGVAGGAVALVAAQTFGPELGLTSASAPRSDAAAALERRLAALEQSTKAAPAANPELAQKLAATEQRLARLDELQKSLTALGEQQTRLEQDANAVKAKLGEQTAPEGAAARIDKLEDRLALMASAAGNDPQNGRVPQLAAITGRIADLETTMNNQLAALRKGVAEQVEARVGLIAEASEAAKSGAARLDRDLSAVKTQTAKIEQRLDALKADGDRTGEKLRLVAEDTAGLRSSLDGLKGDLDQRVKALAKPADIASAVKPIDTRIAAIEQSLQTVVKSEEDRRSNAERIVLSLELANLKRVLDRGFKYSAELAEVKKAAGGRIELAALEKYKDQGVPTLADLQRDFRPVMHAIVDAETEPADGSVVDRLLAGAKNVVRVRKTSHAGDDKSAEAIASRMEAALKDGRLTEVIEESKKLQGRSLAAAQDWLGKVEARASVDRALAEIEKQLKTSLAAAPAGNGQATK